MSVSRPCWKRKFKQNNIPGYIVGAVFHFAIISPFSYRFEPTNARAYCIAGEEKKGGGRNAKGKTTYDPARVGNKPT